MKKWKCISIEPPLMNTNRYENAVKETLSRTRQA